MYSHYDQISYNNWRLKEESWIILSVISSRDIRDYVPLRLFNEGEKEVR